MDVLFDYLVDGWEIYDKTIAKDIIVYILRRPL